MAKVTGPLFSVDARGKIGDSLVFMGWRGLKTVRSYTVPANPQTEEQMRVRNNFTMAVAMWSQLSGADQTAWRNLAAGQAYSGFNDFVGRVKTQLDANEIWALIRNVEVSDITADSATISMVADYDGTYVVRYGTTSGSYPNSELMSLDGEFTEEGTFTAVLSGLSADQTYYFTIQLMDEDGVAGRTGEYTFSTMNGG